MAAITKRDAILEAALGLFVEKGISAATTREIAQKAGTAEGNLYRHFPSKDHLARHLFGECAGRFRKRLLEEVEKETGPRERLAALVRGIFSFARDEAGAFNFILLTHHREFDTGPIRNPQPLPKDLFVDVIRSGIDAGVFREMDPALATSWVVGMAQRSITFTQLGRITVPFEEAADETARAAVRALEPQRGGLPA
ncbi:MAG: TetR/AcrR family transcriptional regulator [Candidatus Eisenbacteria bacterium]